MHVSLYGDTLLMCAVLSGKTMLVKTLLRRGAKINAKTISAGMLYIVLLVQKTHSQK